MTPSRDIADLQRMRQMGADAELQTLARRFFDKTTDYRYSYNFTWFGRPVIQYPADLIAMQEIIWRVQPDLIVETGVAHGGSLVFYASLLELLGGQREVLGIDIDIRPHNRAAIESHAFAHRIRLVDGSSTDAGTVQRVFDHARRFQRVLVCLDSNHTHEHVLAELNLYSPLVKRGSYLVVFDTVIEDMPQAAFPDRPWKRGDNPKTAVHAFLRDNARFVIDEEMNLKLLTTVCPDGYLQCIAD